MMSDMLMRQTEGYVLCVAVGLASGICAGAMNVLIRLLRRHRLLAWMCDITLWLALSVVITAVTFTCSEGDLRLYIFLGFFSGFLITFFTINWGLSKFVNYILWARKHASDKVTRDGKKSR